MTKEEAQMLLDAVRQQEQNLRERMAVDKLRSNMNRSVPVDKDW